MLSYLVVGIIGWVIFVVALHWPDGFALTGAAYTVRAVVFWIGVGMMFGAVVTQIAVRVL